MLLSRVILLLFGVCNAYPSYWVDGGDDGGCGVLVSELSTVTLSSGGMLGRGYDQVDASSLEPVYDSGTGRWEIPLSTDGMGWFATAQEGAFTGAGAADDEGYCDGRFRESRSLQLDSETGLPLSLYWAPPVGQFGSFKIEVGYALPFGIINWYSLAIEVTLTPFPPAPPPSPPATPAPSAPTYFCDIAVVGQGLAGSTAAMVAALLRPDATVCSVGPGTDSSTSAMAGAAWLVIPDVEEAGVAPLVDALATLAAKSELAFDAERSEYFIKMAAAAQAFVESATGTVLKPVLAWEEGEETSRTGPGSTFCTVLGYLQSVPLLGRAVPKLYELGGCAGTATWPPYYDELEEVLAGKVKQVLDESSVGASMCLFMAGAMTMGELMERCLHKSPPSSRAQSYQPASTTTRRSGSSRGATSWCAAPGPSSQAAALGRSPPMRSCPT